MKLLKSALYVLAVILIFSLALLVMISLLEKHMIYYPVKYPGGFWEPERFGVPVEECWFAAEDGVRLHGWYARAPKTDAAFTLLWLHGNAGNITHRVENMRDLLALGVDVFIFDYRGYGKSEGEPDEQGLYLDAVAAYDYLVSEKNVDSDNIVLFGRSLGTAVAVDLATRREVCGIILESAFTDARAMARLMIPFLPVGSVISSRFDSAGKIGGVHVPVLFTHGDRDSIVPIGLGRKLYEAANEPKYFYTIPDADHNDTYIAGGKEYYDRIGEFLDTL
jgi:uncharacterized protein